METLTPPRRKTVRGLVAVGAVSKNKALALSLTLALAAVVGYATAAYAAMPGDLDTTFDGDGKLTTPIGPNDDVARSVAIQTDGKIVVAGYSLNGSNYDFALAR